MALRGLGFCVLLHGDTVWLFVVDAQITNINNKIDVKSVCVLGSRRKKERETIRASKSRGKGSIAVKNKKDKQRRKDELYIAVDMWTCGCQCVTAGNVIWGAVSPKDVEYSLLVLCTSTILSILQFRREGQCKTRVQGVVANFPLILFFVFSVMMAISVVVKDGCVPWAGNHTLHIIIAAAVPIRQFMHILYTIFFEGKE